MPLTLHIRLQKGTTQKSSTDFWVEQTGESYDVTLNVNITSF